MTAVMISIQPVWVEKILNGEKTVEVRKSKPRLEMPFKCYIYCTNQGRPLVYGSPVPSYIGESFVQTYVMSKEKADKVFGVLNGKVVGEFTCNFVSWFGWAYGGIKEDLENFLTGSCLTNKEARAYADNKKELYGWHISDLVVYDKPKELSEFYIERITTTDCPQLTKIKRPPQSWCYVDGMEGENEI